jgi:hypothetical protein
MLNPAVSLPITIKPEAEAMLLLMFRRKLP